MSSHRDLVLSARVRDDITLAGWAMYYGWSYKLRDNTVNNTYSFTRGYGSRELWSTGKEWRSCRVLRMSPWRTDYKSHPTLLKALIDISDGFKHVEVGLTAARQDVQWAGYAIFLGWKVTGLTRYSHAKFTRADGVMIIYNEESRSWFAHYNGELVNSARLVRLLTMAGGHHDDGYYLPPNREEEKEMFSTQRERIFLAMKTE